MRSCVPWLLVAVLGCGAPERDVRTLASAEPVLVSDVPPHADALVPPEPSSLAPVPPPALEPVDPMAATTRPDLSGGYLVTGTTPHRLVLFTFDDGPDVRHTPRLLDMLDEHEIRAVFFVVARRLGVREGPFAEVADVLREIARRGHVVGSHTRDHEILTRLDPDELEHQVVGAEELITEALGARPWLFRPPGGMHDAEVDGFLAGRGYSVFLWSVAASDWTTTDADVVYRNFRTVMRNRESHGTPGGIVVLHDTHRWTIEAFPRIVGWIEDRNCELLETGEELYDVVDDPRLFVVPRPAGTSASTASPPIVLAPEVLAERQARVRARAEARCAR
jgi:peptidoglycan-N-acetylglucosamine deacetylase